ncbi:molecular chaperone SurA [Terrihabitans soli]|uniref:Molecular chaperone SurA n=1 Tax=Terrihabitans soli TaxID=708113 RepID=A0A6S6QQM7_9HYPH|nr:SurA N-terminal domain-containing protein [Terrihabitans soli]BCJ90065.1 molecular chaperone SurA [Terrihabitans soli]
MSITINGLRRRAAFWLGAIILLTATGLGSGSAAAQTSIVALVNNTPITSTEVAERRAVIRLMKKQDIAARAALDQLIDQQLLFAEASRRQIKIADTEVDARFNAIGANAKLSPEQLGQALAQTGASTRAFKAEIRATLLQRKMMGMLSRTATGVSEKEIAAGITAKKTGGEGAAYRYNIQQIIFITQKTASPAQINQRKSEAEGFRRRVTDCAQAINLAKELRETAVKPPVTRMSAQLPGDFRDQLAAMKIGQTTKPDTTPNGVEVIVICDKQEVADDSALRNEVQSELAQETGKAELDKFVADLRKRALIIYK